MEIAATAWLEDEWNSHEESKGYYDSEYVRDTGAISFYPRMFIIYDQYRRRVLTGDAREMSWHVHVTNPAEKSGATVVDALWLGNSGVHAVLTAFVRPERKA